MSKHITLSVDARLEIFSGAYSNDDAYEKVLTYVTRKALWGGYGFASYDLQNVIESFEISEQCSVHKVPRKIWHFIVTFNKKWDMHSLYTLGNCIASSFADGYQVVFAVDIEGNPHLHFAVNNYSYHPNMQPITNERMRSHCCYLLAYIKKCVPGVNHTTISFREDSNV